MATFVVYSNGADDGYIHSNSVVSLAQAQAGGGTLTVDTASTTALVGTNDNSSGGSPWDLYEGFLDFDTSPLAGQTVSAALCSVWITALGASSTAGIYFRARVNDHGTSLTSADWVSANATLPSKTLAGSIKDFPSPTVGAYSTYGTYEGGSLGPSVDVSGGHTRLVLSNDQMESSIPVVNDTTYTIATGDAVGTTTDPVLIAIWSGTGFVDGVAIDHGITEG